MTMLDCAWYMKNQYAKPESAKFFFFAVGAGPARERVFGGALRGWKSLVLLSGDDDEAATGLRWMFYGGERDFPLLLLAWTSSDLGGTALRLVQPRRGCRRRADRKCLCALALYPLPASPSD